MKFKKIIIFCIVSALALIIVLGWSPLSAATRKVVNQLRLASTLNDGLVGYWSFDGKDMNWGDSSNEVTDASPSGNSGNISGFGQEGVRPGVVGQALSFDNVNDQVAMGATGLTGDVTATWSAWIKANSTAYVGYDSPVAIIGSTAALGAFSLFLNSTGSGVVSLTYAGGNNCATAAGVVTAGRWYHLVGTKTAGAINTTSTIYVDGVAVSCTGSASTPNVAAGGTTIGSWPGTYFFDGLIDEVRLYNRALSAGEVAYLYNKNAPQNRTTLNKQKNQPNDGLVGYWNFDGNNMNWGTGIVTDVSGQGNDGVVSGMATTTAPAIGVASQALSFDGVNDYIDAATTGFLSNTGTISLWIKAGVYTGTDAVPFSSVIDSNNRIYLDMGTSHTTWDFNIGNGTSVNTYFFSASAVSQNTWHHVVMEWNSTSMWGYLDGVLGSDGTDSFSINNTFWANTVRIGRYAAASPAALFRGQIDEVRVYNRALSAGEVKELYESAAPEFRSKANVSQDTFMKEGLVGYWPFDGKYMNWGTGIATDVSPSGNNGVVSGMATTTAPAVGIAGQALNFDGTNDWINAGSAGSTLTDNFTLSAWIKTSIKTQDDRIIARRSGASTQWDFMKDSSSRLAMFTGTTYTAVPTNTIDDGGWHLATVVINGSSSRFYADGLPIGSTFSPTITAQAVNTEIGSFQSGVASTLFQGSLDEVRIYNRALSAAEVLQLYNSSKH